MCNEHSTWIYACKHMYYLQLPKLFFTQAHRHYKYLQTHAYTEKERERERDCSRIQIKSSASKRKPSELYGIPFSSISTVWCWPFHFSFFGFSSFWCLFSRRFLPCVSSFFLHYLLVVSFQFHNQWLWVYSVGPGYGVCLCYFDFSKFAFIFNMHLRCCFRVGEFCFLVSLSLSLFHSLFHLYLYTMSLNICLKMSFVYINTFALTESSV